MRRWIVQFTIIMSIICIAPTFCYANSQKSLTAKEGMLDLRSLNVSEEILPLRGEWEFYWRQLYTPKKLHSFSHKEQALITVPSVWANSNYTGSHVLSNEGYGTYRLVILVSEESRSKPLSLHIPPIASAYKIWINGKLAAENGVVGTSRSTMTANSHTKTLTFETSTTEIELVIQVSNFAQRKGGIWKEIKIGGETLIYQLRGKDIMKKTFLTSSLFTLGFYHLVLYMFYRTNRLSLFLGVFCIIAALRTVLVGDRFLISWLPFLSWEFTVKLEYLTMYIGCMLLVIFVSYLYPNEANHFITRAFSVICILFSLTTLLPAIYYTKWLLFFETILIPVLLFVVYTIIRAAIKKRLGALTNCIILCIMIAAILNDVFYYHFFFLGTDATPTGAFLGLLVQSLIIARKSSLAFTNVERLSVELQLLNQSLEERIAQRTAEWQDMNKELQKANEALQTIEQTRQQLFASIAHELGTPMQSIQGYVQLIQEGLPQPEQEKYLQIVYEKTKLLNRLSRDLLELAKMEEKQIQFQFEEIPASELWSYLCQFLQVEMEQSDLRYRFTCLTAPDELILKADLIRLEQVFSNLSQNAMRHTPAGGEIFIHSEAYCTLQHGQEQWWLRIFFSDTGSGIEPELIPRLFQRFVKSSRPSEKKGSGLGLAICQQIIKNHGGDITVNSILGQGSQFTITLPAILRKEGNRIE